MKTCPSAKKMLMLKKLFETFLLWMLSKRPMHGYEIMKTFHGGKGLKEARPALIYPLLNSMLEDGLIEQKTIKDGKRVKKVYAPSTKGMKEMQHVKVEFFQTGLRKQFFLEMVS